MPLRPHFTLRAALAHAFALTATAAAAQTALPPAAPASAPVLRPRPAAAAAAAASAPAAAQRIEITGGRNADVDERRQSTAAKIVIGREEIDKFGDATVGEVLRRLPGVSTPGAPGRGGPPRMRGLGNGYTQLLIDGQRVPPGFSIESLTPEQVERIEILRAPTAETGAQAVAGTINIITREGFKRRLNDLRIGFGYENGKLSPGLNWTHNDSAGDLTYNLSGSAFFPRRENSSSSHTTVTNMASGALLEDRTASSVSDDKRVGMNLTSRLQWRLGEGGDQFALTPSVFHTEASNQTRFSLAKALSRPGTPSLYDYGDSEGDSRFTNARLGLQWRQKVGPVRLEVNGGGGSFKSVNNSVRNEFGAVNRVLEDRATVRENSINLTFKGSGAAGGAEAAAGGGGGEHNLVSGAEIDASRRNESKTNLQNGLAYLPDGSNLQAQALRTAAYVQDEWAINPNWAAQGGLRWEGIHTRGDNGSAAASAGVDPNPTNRSSVWTPLFHAVWKPDAKKRDQVRLSLTRSYRPPSLGTLIARPSINRDYPTSATNVETSPDSAGNPNLKPELASGIDLAFERYLDGGGVLSANLFHREISNLMRGRTALETVSYSPVPRWVRRTQNIGDATTSGLEMDAKFRLDQVIAGTPGVELRANLSLYTSKVSTVPGPDNRLDQQAKATGNIGADYRLRGLPLSLGGNFNWAPGNLTKTDVGQFNRVTDKRVWDAYALWTFSPAVGLRLLGNNLVPRDYTSTTISETQLLPTNERTTVASTGPSYINWQLRLELKL